MRRSRVVRALGLCLGIPVLCGILFSCTSFAKEVHVYKSTFGEEGAGPGQFKQPAGVAVNETTHDVYVVDGGNDRVEEFNSAGIFITEFNGFGSLSEPSEIAVDNSVDMSDPSREDVYIVNRGSGVIEKFDSSGTPLFNMTGDKSPCGPFESGEAGDHAIEGVTVDPNGILWVAVKKGPICSYTDAIENAPRSSIENAFGGANQGLGVDFEDNLYLKRGSDTFAKVAESGEIISNPFGTKGVRLAVDPYREVYLDDLKSVTAFTLSGEEIETFGSESELLKLSVGVAVDAGTGTVYVTDREANSVLIFEGILLPGVAILPPSEQHTRSLTLNGSVNPEGTSVSLCVFEYGLTNAYGQSVPCSPSNVGSGLSPVPVSAHLEGLLPDTEYHYRLVSGNSAPITSPTPDQVVFTGPSVGQEFVTNVAASSATLHVTLDPKGGDTHYYFEYGPTLVYGSFAPSSPPGSDAGSTVGELNIDTHIQNLIQHTVYHYRFVAVQDGEIFDSPDRLFTTQSSGGSEILLDGRAWELVSPADKKGALLGLFEQGGQIQAASDGSGITYITEGPHVGGNPTGRETYAQVLSRRQENGNWSSEDLTLPGRLPENGQSALAISQFQFEYHLFSPDLSLAFVEPQIAGTPPLSPDVTERTLYLRDNANASFLPLVTPSNVPAGTKLDEPVAHSEWDMQFLAATPDLSHVLFKTPLAFTPEAIDEESQQGFIENKQSFETGRVQWNIYEWRTGGVLGLVNVLPEGKIAHGSFPAFPPVRLAGIKSEVGLGAGGTQRALSDDGRFVAWTWGEPYGGEIGSYRGLFVRDMASEETRRVGGASAIYETMSSDGSKVFFLEKGDLYVFSFDSDTSTDLTVNHGSSEPNAGVQEIVSGVSKDGSYVYFIATSELAAGGVSGENNLYVLHDTNAGWITTYVATLGTEDRPSWYAETFNIPYLAHTSSRVSQNGRFFVFMSDRSLTGYDNIDAVSGMPDEEVYVYDAVSGQLRCVSCSPSGARPTGVFDTPQSELLVDLQGVWTSTNTTEHDKHTNHWLAGSVPGWDDLNGGKPVTYQPRYLSDDGQVFFDSPDGLVAQDTNGLEDVYEFEPVGVRDCVTSSVSFSSVSGGCVGLISSGTSSSESAFYDASEDGGDVFFTTTSKLVVADYDKGYDVYDAHICASSHSCPMEPTRPPPCASGDSCKPAPTVQPDLFGPPPSATFNGQGNVLIHPVTRVKTKLLTRREKLTRALKECRKGKSSKRRKLCERRARKRFDVRIDRRVAFAGLEGGR